jgi:hypothetical protein
MSSWKRIGCGVVLAGALILPSGPARATPVADGYIEGYATAILERELRGAAPSLRVQDGVIAVSAADLAALDRGRIVAALGRIRGVTRVDVLESAAPPPVTAPAPPASIAVASSAPATSPRILKELATGFLPGGELLFKPLIADPRWPHFSASYQRYLGDKQLKDVAATSFGETFAFYRGRAGAGWWELGLQAGVFALFDLNAPSADLINADYFVAVPVSYRYDEFSAMFRLFHQSSHLGDEFLLRSRVNRVNLSYEGIDGKLSYELGDVWRAYGGAGYLFHRDPTSLKPWSVQYGLEFRSPWPSPEARWRPIAAADVQNREMNDWHADFSLRAGIQLDGVLVTRNLQLLLEYFRGHSPNGQFYRQKIDYLGLGVHFHF